MTTPASTPAVTPEPDFDELLEMLIDAEHRHSLRPTDTNSEDADAARRDVHAYVTSLRSRLTQAGADAVDRELALADKDAELTALRTELEEANRRAKHAELGFADLQSRYAGKTQCCDGCESLARELEQVRRDIRIIAESSRRGDLLEYEVAEKLDAILTTQDGNK